MGEIMYLHHVLSFIALRPTAGQNVALAGDKRRGSAMGRRRTKIKRRNQYDFRLPIQHYRYHNKGGNLWGGGQPGGAPLPGRRPQEPAAWCLI